MWRWFAWICAIYAWNCGAIRRFTVKNGYIQPTRMIADEHEWQQHLKTSLNTSIANADADSLFMRRVFAEQVRKDPVLSSVQAQRAFALVQVNDRSVFFIDTKGRIVERHLYGDGWGFLLHHDRNDFDHVYTEVGDTFVVQRTWRPAVAITRLVHETYEGVVVADAAGRMAIRLAEIDGTMRWVDCSIDDHRVYSSGHAARDGTMYVVSHEGRIFARKLLVPSSRWKLIPMPENAIAALTVFVNDEDLYVLTLSGQLLALSLDTWTWSDVSPATRRLQVQPALAEDTGSLHFVSSSGLSQFVVDSNEWIHHGQPPGGHIDGSLSSCGDDCVLVGDGERFWRFVDGYTWTRVPTEPHRIHKRAPRVCLEDDTMLALLEDGRLVVESEGDWQIVETTG